MSLTIYELAADGKITEVIDEVGRNPHRVDEMDRNGVTALQRACTNGKNGSIPLILMKVTFKF
jgi:ankyrin repeat protein